MVNNSHGGKCEGVDSPSEPQLKYYHGYERMYNRNDDDGV